MRRPPILATALLALVSVQLAGQLAGQTQPQPAAPTAGTKTRVSLERHDESTSRRMFAVCDADADDRLDLFEATDAVESLGDPRQVRSFARVDTDRDGYVSWPEFDAYYRLVISHGKTLNLRPCRPLPPVEAPPQTPAASPLQRFLRLYDENRNGVLDPTEVDRIAEQLGLPPMLVAMLRNLDADRSGSIDDKELGPSFPLIEKLLPKNHGTTAADSSLPAPWGLGDDDADGTLSRDELTNLLRRLDPGLARWAEQLFALLDKNRDGQLDASELGVSAKTTSTTALLR